LIPSASRHRWLSENRWSSKPTAAVGRTVVWTSCSPSGARGRVRPGQALRRASEADTTTRLKQKQREQEAYRVALLKVRERGLEMKLTRAEQQPDGSRLVFYFTSDGRVDFRELVRELAAEFHTRIEMRHIGTATRPGCSAGTGRAAARSAAPRS
jgi:cell fate regulator YaaT (PSP1 superfamily)